MGLGYSADEGWRVIPGGRARALVFAEGGRAGFEGVPATASGVTFVNGLNPDRGLFNQIFFNGSGVALGDVDGDGLCDIYFCSLEKGNSLYRNLGGWRFELVAGAGGAAMEGKVSTGAVLVDLDGDRDLDLIVNTVGQGTWIFFNDGKGRFQSTGAPLNVGRGGTSLAVADFDGNGTLDLYVTNYRTNTLRDMPNTRFQGNLVDGKPTVLQVNGRPTTEPDLVGRYSIGANGGIIENGEPDVLFWNDGRGHFSPVAWTSGTFLDEEGNSLKAPPYDWGLSVLARDLNGDGAPDLYVCNDFDSPDRIWLNDGKGKFRAVSKLSFRKTSLFSMGVDVADVDRDGRPDIFVADMLSPIRWVRHGRMSESAPQPYQPGRLDHRPQYMRNMLHWNRGDGTFAEIGYYAGVEASEWSWTPVFLDVDLDGYEDLLITNGHARDDVNIDNANRIGAIRSKSRLTDREILMLRKDSPRIAPPNVAFRNRGNLTFAEMGGAWHFDQAGVSQGMAVADLDGDGDLDVVINNLDAPATLLRNTSSAPRVEVRLKGVSPNTGGIGAKVKVSGGPVMQWQEFVAGGRYLSSDGGSRVFAAGTSNALMQAEVVWRSGRVSRYRELAANHLYEFDEAGAVSEPVRPSSPLKPWFADASDRLQYRHVDEPYDDSERQGLMPWRLSLAGPGAVWSDLDNDGWDDLVIGSGKGGQPGVFLNDRKGGFQPWVGAPFDVQVARDQTAWVSAALQSGERRILFSGSSNYEDGLTNGAAVVGWNPATKTKLESFPGYPWSAGPLALGDFDGDGELELFLGGRAMSGEYPKPASSVFSRWKNGAWVVDAGMSAALQGVGLVQSAVFTDLDQDGKVELVLALEWGPIRIFAWHQGKVVERTAAYGLGQLRGLWQGVMAADVDGDGRMDLIVSNWGLNSHYRASQEHPLRVYSLDYDGDGIPEVLLSEWDPVLGKEVPVRGRKAMVRGLPMLAEKQPTFDGYGKASMQEIFGEKLKEALVLEAGHLESVLLLNRGERFEVRSLPPAAQWSPGYGLGAADFDGDGNVDLFLAQNLFAVDAESGQQDAGAGLLMRGDGHGGFQVVPPSESGLAVYGEQRGVAISDFNHDGRMDLLVTQNNQESRLFVNQLAVPGLRVRLVGEGKNPDAIGASARLKSSQGWSRAQEVQAGSGYWSQNTLELVFATKGEPAEVEVRWPGGRLTTSRLPERAMEVTVGVDGSLKEVKTGDGK